MYCRYIVFTYISCGTTFFFLKPSSLPVSNIIPEHTSPFFFLMVKMTVFGCTVYFYNTNTLTYTVLYILIRTPAMLTGWNTSRVFVCDQKYNVCIWNPGRWPTISHSITFLRIKPPLVWRLYAHIFTDKNSRIIEQYSLLE